MTTAAAVAAVTTAVSLLLIAYILVGYPLLLLVLRRFRANPVRTGDAYLPTVTAVIAVHNGEASIGGKLESLRGLDYPSELLNIVVASDGSTDRTLEIARGFDGVTVLDLPKGTKCTALNAGIAQATGEILLLTDVRQPVEPQSLRMLIRNFADPSVGSVSGLLKIRTGGLREAEEIGAYWRYEAWIRDSLSAIDSIFGASGAYYAMRRDLAPVNVPGEILLDDMYLPLAAFRRGYRLIMEPAAVFWDQPTDRSTEFARKVRTLAGNYQILRHYPWLLSPANRMWLHFASYKAARLVLPWLLLIVLIAPLWLPSPWRELLVVPQVIGYALAALHPWLPRPLHRLSSPLRTLCMMMFATVAGLKVFFVPAERIWKVTKSR
ncbi:MAG: glycosyltransferase [Acidobacteria bacterium]|nr:glycosyltransferase [Acidobacteriota bacterium]